MVTWVLFIYFHIQSLKNKHFQRGRDAWKSPIVIYFYVKQLLIVIHTILDNWKVKFRFLNPTYPPKSDFGFSSHCFSFNFQEFSIECLKPRICYLEFTALWMKAVIIYCNLVWVAIHARYILPFDWEIYDKDPNRRSMKSCIKKCMSYNANIIYIRILITYKLSTTI